MTFTFTISI